MTRDKLNHLYQQAVDCLARTQPALEVVQTHESVIIRGGFQVTIEDVVHDCFDIRVEIDSQFPEVEPRLFEGAGRIPRDIDRHMYPDGNGLCCFGVWAEWLATGPRSVERFLLETMSDFFFSQHYYELHPEFEERDRWPLGERSHGQQGIIEGCARVLGVPSTLMAVLDAMIYVIGEDHDRNALCLCGSGRRFKRCHRSQLWLLRTELDSVTIKAMLAALK